MNHRPEVSIARLNAGDFIELEAGFLLLPPVAREAMFLEKGGGKLLKGVDLSDCEKWIEQDKNEHARNPYASIPNEHES